MKFSDEALDWLSQATGITPGDLHLVRMKGSTSSTLFHIRSLRDRAHQGSVLRLLDNREWLAEEPDLAAHEIAALQEGAVAGLRVPLPLGCSNDRSIFGAPVVLMSLIEGDVELRPSDFGAWLEILAGELARIHDHAAGRFPWHYRSWVDRENLTPPRWSLLPDLWQRAIDRVVAGQPEFDPVFIHRDYHPTNVLWQRHAISGVVDWINACAGPAGVDVAHCRTNLARMYGPAVAEQFLHAYCTASPMYRHEPYWELDSILDISGSDSGFYPPWREFGLEIIPEELLASRIEKHLANVIAMM